MLYVTLKHSIICGGKLDFTVYKILNKMKLFNVKNIIIGIKRC
jgi:hypothetical protein